MLKLSQSFAKQRIVIIGDIHGCFDELKELVNSYVKSTDLVILVGDIINKGPKSLETLYYVKEKKFLSVRGNHDQYIINVVSENNMSDSQGFFGKMREWFLASFFPASISKEMKPKRSIEEWMTKLTPSDIEWLNKLPYQISIPYHNSVVVHAGFIPKIPFEKQEPKHMMTLRNIEKKNDSFFGYSGIEKGERWVSFWKGPEHIYFGHDARRKLQKEEFATGLDTGCLYGGELTAVILNPDHSREFVKIKAKKTYVVPGKQQPS